MRRALPLALALLAACSDITVHRAIDRIQTPIANPSWTGDIVPVLFETCGSSGACHGLPTPQRQLPFEGPPQSIYDSLVNHQSRLFTSMKRVIPAKPDSSVVYLMLSDTTTPFHYLRMPLAKYPLPDAVRLTIRNWIQNGAPNN